jgi:hypothetical protein
MAVPSLIGCRATDSLNFEKDAAMKPDAMSDLTIPADLDAEIRAAAVDAHRPADEIVREALQRYLADWRAARVPDARRRAEAAARMRAQRHGRVLPEGVTIEDMIAHGRA